MQAHGILAAAAAQFEDDGVVVAKELLVPMAAQRKRSYGLFPRPPL